MANQMLDHGQLWSLFENEALAGAGEADLPEPR